MEENCMIKKYTPEVTVSNTIYLEKICSHCGRVFKSPVKVSCTARGESRLGGLTQEDYEKTGSTARAGLSGEIEGVKNKAEKGVLCPYCNHFSVDAMEKHFPKGYLNGIKKKYISEGTESLLVSLGAAFFAFILIGIFFYFGASHDDVWANILMYIIIITGCICLIGFICSLILGIYILVKYPSIRQLLKNASEDELISYAIESYKKNDNSLSGGRWNKVLLKKWSEEKKRLASK